MPKHVSIATRKKASATLTDLKGRREFLFGLSGVAAALAGAGWVTSHGGAALADALGPLNNSARLSKAIHTRIQAAKTHFHERVKDHPDNGDEALYPNRVGSFSKGLSHNAIGEVDPAAYAALLKAVKSGLSRDFEDIPGAGKLVSPQAAYAVLLEGFDPCSYVVPAAPKFASALEAAEMAEVYWMSLARDVAFTDYATDPLTNQAAADLSTFSDYNGPRVNNGTVSPVQLFRGILPGDSVGPYLSQFLLQNFHFGSIEVAQQSSVPQTGLDYNTSFADFMAIQNGQAAGPQLLDPTPRYLRNLRDLGQYVHVDFPQQEVLTAALYLLGHSAINPANPYLGYQRQASFATFGAPGLLDLAVRVPVPGLIATWYQKWCVHRRLRPEEFAGRIHVHRTGGASYPIDTSILNSHVLDLVFSKYGSYLLPMGYPEGCPMHPAYTAGHATFAGASATVLKALFDENFVIPNPVQASADGLSLLPYSGTPLSAGGELNKMASNIALGRDAMGVHWRTDAIEGIRLGEAMAISILKDYKFAFNEGFTSTFTKFDGKSVTI